MAFGGDCDGADDVEQGRRDDRFDSAADGARDGDSTAGAEQAVMEGDGLLLEDIAGFSVGLA